MSPSHRRHHVDGAGGSAEGSPADDSAAVPLAPPPPPIASEDQQNKRAKRDLFGDCALVEIIHLHDCLRGAVTALQRDVTELSRTLLSPCSPAEKPSSGSAEASASAVATQAQDRVADLERRVAGRFKVIWSVFKAHSAAEDEFIWPALQSKQVGGAGSRSPTSDHGHGGGAEVGIGPADPGNGAVGPALAAAAGGGREGGGNEDVPCVIEQEEYEEDHANEESMFRTMDSLLSQLREGLSEQRRRSSSIVQEESDAGKIRISGGTLSGPLRTGSLSTEQPLTTNEMADASRVREMARKIDEITSTLSQHLMTHLDKEETQCMPLVRKHLSKSEINDLVGRIMGRRSSDLMSQIMTMAVQNLDDTDRDEMVRYMKQAMVGTFFERWLSMGGWMNDKKHPPASCMAVTNDSREPDCDEKKMPAITTNAVDGDTKSPAAPEPDFCSMCASAGRCLATDPGQCHNGASTVQNAREHEKLSNPVALEVPHAASAVSEASVASASATASQGSAASAAPTSPKELESLIRAIASNPKLTPVQKNTTIQGLRDSVWRNQHRSVAASSDGGMGGAKRKRDEADVSMEIQPSSGVSVAATSASATTVTRSRRVTPPSAYYKKGPDGKVVLVWSSDSPSGGAQFPPNDRSVPLFSASELAPTYFDGATGAVLGCPHYARSCKLRHPSSGRLYTCRLCCEQERDMPMKDQDSPLDRYAVTEVLCMRCGALQPASDGCCNAKCETHGKPYAKYTCRICNFYDDGPQKNIYHCPFCNVCRTGLGLGIDYRHCMRCNACVSLKDDEHHCIPQRLQGNCPICHESMFQSTEPLRGLKCGHVMHLSCYNHYVRGQSYTCPLCKKCVEDMKDYFALLDAAVRMQPMPAAYSNMISNIYCQDCGQTGSVQYHFVGCKCSHCGSYNTRELGRFEGAAAASMPF